MSIFKRNVDLRPPLALSSWRKAAIGTWAGPGDPSVYGVLELEVDRALEYLDQLKQTSGARLTLSHLVGRAMAIVLKEHPDINAILRWGQIYPRPQVDVFFQVATDEEGKDLTGAVIRQADQKSLLDIARELETKVKKIRKHGDLDFAKMKSVTALFPGIFSRLVVSAGGWLLYLFNLWTPLLGLPRDPFGSLMVTNIGSIGLDMAFAPLVPYSRVPLIIVVSQVQEVPRVRNGQIVIARVLKLCATFDHRIIDGMHAAKMTQTLRRLFNDPTQLS